MPPLTCYFVTCLASMTIKWIKWMILSPECKRNVTMKFSSFDFVCFSLIHLTKFVLLMFKFYNPKNKNKLNFEL